MAYGLAQVLHRMQIPVDSAQSIEQCLLALLSDRLDNSTESIDNHEDWVDVLPPRCQRTPLRRRARLLGDRRSSTLISVLSTENIIGPFLPEIDPQDHRLDQWANVVTDFWSQITS